MAGGWGRVYNFLSLFFTNIVTHTIKRVQFVKGVVYNDLIIVAVTKKYPQNKKK